MPERQQFPGADEVDFLDPGKDQQSEGHREAMGVGGGRRCKRRTSHQGAAGRDEKDRYAIKQDDIRS